MEQLRNLFLISFLFIFVSFTYSWSQLQENSISREELRKIIDMIEDNGLDDGICEWRGLDSDTFLSDNERFDLVHTSIYKYIV